MSTNEEITRLTGTLVWKTDNRPLLAFQKNLTKVHSMLSEFSTLANKKFNIKVTLDAKSLRAQLDRAANAKVVFKNFAVDVAALDLVQSRMKEKLDNTRINLKNIKINMSSTMAERAGLRKQIEGMAAQVRIGAMMTSANATLRQWKIETEQKFKLHLNADISRSKLFRNAAASLKAVVARLGTIRITGEGSKVRLSVDKEHLKAEIAAVLAQIKKEVKIKIDLNSTVSGRGSRGSSGGSGGMGRRGHGHSVVGEGWGLAQDFLPGLGAAYAIGELNKTNQAIQGQRNALLSVTGNQKDADATQKRYEQMGNEIGFNTLKNSPVFVKMLAAGQGTGFTQPQSEKIFKNMAEYGRTMGLTDQNMHLALMAVERMMSKGQIYSRELKGELALQFPGAEAMMAKAMHMTIPELIKAMKGGKVTALDALPEFAELLHQQAIKGGALQKSEQSSAANQSRMDNAFTKSVTSFSDGGFERAMSAFFGAVAGGVEKAQPLIKALGAAFLFLMRPVVALINILGDLAQKWPDMAAGLGLSNKQLAILAVTAIGLMSPLGTLLLALGGIALVVEDLVSFSKGKDSIFGKLLLGLDDEKLKNVFMLGEAFTEAKDAVEGMFTALKDLIAQVVGTADKDAFSSGIGWYFDQIIIRTQDAMLVIRNLAHSITSLAHGDFKGAWEGIKDNVSIAAHDNLPNRVLSMLPMGLGDDVNNRYNAQTVGLNNAMTDRLGGVSQRQGLMNTAATGAQDITDSLGVSAATFTGPITLSFPNLINGNPSDIEQAVGRVMSTSLQLVRANQKEVK